MIKIKDIYEYDIVIIGGGISGCEASYISAVNGAKTLLITINTDSIGHMSFENYISNTDGINAAGNKIWQRMALPTAAGKLCFESKIVKSLKNNKIKDFIIIDRKRLMMALKAILERQKNITIRQSLVIDIVPESNIFNTLTNDGTTYKSKAVILAPGTFLDSNIFWGNYNIAAGRPGEIASKKLLNNLIKIGFKFKKAKLYAGPKIDGRTLDLNKYYRNKKKFKLNIIPEGKETKEMYIDGFNNSNGEEEQLKTMRRIQGLENVIMTRPGYGINYNILSPSQINKNLESKKFPGLFFCGRINGRIKYEDTAAEGYLAGTNASKKVK